MKDLTVSRPFNEDEYNELLRQAVAVLPWSHNLLLMSHDLSPKHIVFYANEVLIEYCFIVTYQERPNSSSRI